VPFSRSVAGSAAARSTRRFMTTGVARRASQVAASFTRVGGRAPRGAPGLELTLDLASTLFRRQQASGAIRWATPLAFAAAWAWRDRGR
jgi:hypothetical protein